MSCDLFNNRCRIIQDLFVRESEDDNSFSGKKCVPNLIVVPLFVLLMDRPVALDCDGCFLAKKVSHVIAKLMLSPELEAKELTISEDFPQDRLRRCFFLAKCPGELQ